MSSSEGFGFFSSSATAETIIPGVQKPHWNASASRNAAWTGWSRPLRASPSIVVIVLPAASATGRPARPRRPAVQEHRARPALPLAAAVLGARQPEPVAEDREEALLGRRLDAAPRTIHVQDEHVRSPPEAREQRRL